jgi:hypothetical protein
MTGLASQRPSPMAHTEKALSMPRAASTVALAALRAQFGQTRGDVGLGNSNAMRCPCEGRQWPLRLPSMPRIVVLRRFFRRMAK